MGASGGIVGVDLLTLLFLRTAVTDIGRCVQGFTFCRIEFRTQALTVVFLTELTAIPAAVYGFCRAQILLKTASVPGTAVGRESVVVSGKGTVILYFPRYGRGGSADLSGDIGKSQIIIQVLLDEGPVVQGKMFHKNSFL